MNGRKLFKGFRAGIKASFSNPARIGLTVLFTGLTFALMVLASRPNYSLQVLGYGIQYLPEALNSLFFYNTPGPVNRFLTALYALTAGIALTGLSIQLRTLSISLKSLGSLTPGFLATGCASCGAGLLGFLGLSGGLAALPFGGNTVLFGGSLLIAFFIAKNGNPETCAIDGS